VAIDDLPLPVVNFLNAIGVPWPYLNEDTVTQFASLVRGFRQAVHTTHQDATRAVAAIARAHRSVSTERMQAGWQKLSARHVDELMAGCTVLADALDAAAGYIVVQKAGAIGVLTGMAAAFFADQAASVATLGLAEAAAPAIIEGAQRLVESLVMDVQQYVVAAVIEAAARPLFTRVESALAGLDWAQAGTAAGTPAGFSLDAAGVHAQTQALRTYAAALRDHAAAFEAGVRGLSF